MWIYQIEPTIQGEGKYAGTPVVLVRFMLCNLKCSAKEGGFDCDTDYTWKQGKLATGFHLTAEEAEMDVIDTIYSADETIRAVMITGGEPLIWQHDKEFVKFLRLLKSIGLDIHVETNGTMPLLKSTKELIDVFAISPKQSQYASRYNDKNVQSYFDTEHFWKFVCSTQKDFDNIESFLLAHHIPTSDDIFLMPEGDTPAKLDRHRDFINNSDIIQRLNLLGYRNVFQTDRLQIRRGII